jgi:hypothetical protein
MISNYNFSPLQVRDGKNMVTKVPPKERGLIYSVDAFNNPSNLEWGIFDSQLQSYLSLTTS